MSSPVLEKVNHFFTAYPLQNFRRQQIIIRPDEPLKHVFYLTEGRVAQYDITPNGNEVVVNVFKAGAFFPMSTALNQTPNLYYFETSTEAKAHIAPVAATVQFLTENPDVALDLLKRVYRGVDGVLRRMAHLMGGDAGHRLLFELINAAYRFGEQQADGSVRVPLKEGDIARQSGLARETVNRHMQSFKATGLIEIRRAAFVIKDVKKLESLLGNTI